MGLHSKHSTSTEGIEPGPSKGKIQTSPSNQPRDHGLTTPTQKQHNLYY
jgi:hypothetical protein